jgi:hypothetical protein
LHRGVGARNRGRRQRECGYRNAYDLTVHC